MVIGSRRTNSRRPLTSQLLALRQRILTVQARELRTGSNRDADRQMFRGLVACSSTRDPASGSRPGKVEVERGSRAGSP
jgi:hypothetical protein